MNNRSASVSVQHFAAVEYIYKYYTKMCFLLCKLNACNNNKTLSNNNKTVLTALVMCLK